MMTTTESYYDFLIRHRIYCERCTDLTHATTVEKVNGRDTCLCDIHAQRLKAARKSDAVFEEQEAKCQTTIPRIEITL